VALPKIKLLVVLFLIAGIALLIEMERTEAAIDMTGTWNVNLRNNSGAKLDNCIDIITQTRSALSVTVSCSSLGSGSLTGTITKSTGDFVGLSGTVGGDAVSFSGNTDGSSASGSWSSTFLSGTFTATKKFPIPAPTPSLTITVNSTVDAVDVIPGNGTCATAGAVCTLRAAIQEANALAISVTQITVPAGTYTLTIAGNGEDSSATGDLDITTNLRIVGAAAAKTTVAQSTNDRVFDILAGNVVFMAGLTIKDGALSTGLNGGGIRNAGNLTLVDSAVRDNTSTGGGAGISSIDGSLAVSNSIVHGNTASAASAGGGIAHVGLNTTLTLTNVTISDNAASVFGGGALHQHRRQCDANQRHDCRQRGS